MFTTAIVMPDVLSSIGERPSNVRRTRVEPTSLRRGDVSLARPHLQRGIAEFNTNRVPAPVLVAGARIAQVILLAQLISDTGHRRIEVARIATVRPPLSSVSSRSAITLTRSSAPTP